MGVSVKAARLLVRALREPASAAAFSPGDWEAVLTAAHAEALGGALAARLADVAVPPPVSRRLAHAAGAAQAAADGVVWEAEMARRALAPTGVELVLLKGAAYRQAGLDAARGRQIGDLDILVPRARLAETEEALGAAGWESLKADDYDDAYYRRWMHELPPLIHSTRDRIIDVHHTILPPTARPTPDCGRLLAHSVSVAGEFRVLSPSGMVIHAAAHLLADGDLAGGLRNLWDIDRLVREFTGRDGRFLPDLLSEARHHELEAEVRRSLRLSHHLFATPVDQASLRLRGSDRLFLRRLLARDGWGRARRPLTRWAFYVRSHWLRMPPHLLIPHLWVKARRRGGRVRREREA